MSKQSEAKQAQGYEQKPVIPVCVNCKHYISKFVDTYDNWGSYQIEKNYAAASAALLLRKWVRVSYMRRRINMDT